MTIRLEASWLARLESEFQQPYMQKLRAFLQQEKEAGKVIYPPGKAFFAAMDMTPFDQTKVVILGQDPYHGRGQAHGLCFSVPKGQQIPPSLRNIFQELADDMGVAPNSFPHGCLSGWATQGVLLLNAVLTVERGRPASHQGRGWEEFTDRIFACLSAERENLVFMLWGSHAQKKGEILDRSRHLVLQSPHPSPYSAHRGFFGCRHFSKANQWLAQHDMEPIDWLRFD